MNLVRRQQRMRGILFRFAGVAMIASAAMVGPFAAPAPAGDTVRLVAQRTGTFGWELDVIRAHGLDKAAGLSLDVTELASPEAGKIALRGGSADIVVSDWIW